MLFYEMIRDVPLTVFVLVFGAKKKLNALSHKIVGCDKFLHKTDVRIGTDGR